jgi:hypothetical protein
MKFLIVIITMMAFCAQNLAKEARISLLSGENKKSEGIKKKRAKKKSGAKEALLKNLLETNKKIKSLLISTTSEPVIWDGTKAILTGKVYRGILMNSIVSTNLASPVLVKVYENQGLPVGTLFSCKGATKNKRVLTYCNKMITKNKEVAVSAQVLNLDGTSGLLGAYEDGKDELITAAVLSEVAAGVLSTASSKVSSPFGSYPDSSLKNQVIGGLVSGGSSTSEILLDEMKTKEPIVTVNAGSEVLIYFMEALHDY